MKIAAFIIIAIIVLFVEGCFSPRTKQDGLQRDSDPQPFVQKEVDAIGQFKWGQRLQIRTAIDGVALRLLAIGKSSPPIREGKSKLMEGFATPIIALYDKDLDGSPDTFANIAVGGTISLDFSFIFDLNHDGRIDYAVFNGGPLPTKDMKVCWMNYHYIDSNYDGRVDIVIYNVYLDWDGFLDKNIGAWLYDTDFDGAIDKGEYLGMDVEMSIPGTDDGFLIKSATGEKRLLKKDLQAALASLSSLLSEVNELLSQGK